jgi:predicted nucleic acid-binding protein
VFLLDTDVLSELRKPKRDANVMAWFDATRPTDMFVSIVSVVEIERGIERKRQEDSAFAAELGEWLDALLRLYGERVLPLTITIARRWGRLSAQIGNKNVDLAISATALEHGLAVVTRNVRHHTPTGVLIVNPFEPKTGRR